MADFTQARAGMVERQIAGRGVRDPALLAAMREVPREAFVPDRLAEFAYDDTPLPIAEGQTISQPYIVALMSEAADIRPGDRVLDVGTGSGYAAAVLSRMAGTVYTIERHAALSDQAREIFARLGYDNIVTAVGDGSLGWPEEAPFDAILVAAGAPSVPEALKRQLAVGGRLVLPVGASERQQTLLRIRRTGENDYREEDLGAVAFVPLVGKAGWPGDGTGRGGDAASRARPLAFWRRPDRPDPVRLMRDAAEPLPDIDEDSFGATFDRLGDARLVLLGEATHGTSEFYRARARITRRLIERHGFTIVAVEADWPDAARIDRFVRHRPPVAEEEPAFARFPTWMWRNREVHDFVLWLRAHNAGVGDRRRQAGFYGLDLYSLNSSIRAVLDYLDKVDPEAARIARERYGCLTPWQADPATYGRAALSAGFRNCEQAVAAQLRELLDRRLDYMTRDGESYLDAARNASLVAAAERYYRIMYYGSRESWNLRDGHMFDTLEATLAARGPEARAVVWAHNSHIGNAAATEMGWSRGELNIGQLCREKYGEAARLIGFGTDRGTVAAATDWDGDMEIKQVRPALPDSYERLSHETAIPSFLLDLRGDGRAAVRDALRPRRLERAIGVIYRPETERWSHYFDAVLPEQFDAWVWFDETRAVTPLTTAHGHGMPETYPFGL